MCNPGPYFKLCTCDPKHLGDNYWRLHRGGSSEIRMVVGSFSPPIEFGQDVSFDTDFFAMERLIFDINSHSVFDFEYNPIKGDVLEIVIGEDLRQQLIYDGKKFHDADYSVSQNYDGENLAFGNIRYVPKP
jgi:hypothetical protein